MKRTLLTLSFLMLSSPSWAGKHAISGLVVDRNGEPVPQAIVSLSPGNVEMITDREGRFVIQYLRDEDGDRLKIAKRLQYNIEVFKAGFHIETRTLFYKRGEAIVDTIRMVEETIRIHDDKADLAESLETKPTHSAGANYEGQ